ncbi:hypothetical protein R1flu_015268 [Riccia fluitans]|uniref:PPIase cyclophilin-type domain-containing protein n=1 Tax=Riccia fluitans TaxID=41844 RepID=A0ABD1YLK4_9MARC
MLSMANTGKDTNGSQFFFLCTAPPPPPRGLTVSMCCVGKFIERMMVIMAIEGVGSSIGRTKLLIKSASPALVKSPIQIGFARSVAHANYRSRSHDLHESNRQIKLKRNFSLFNYHQDKRLVSNVFQ